VFVDVVCVQMFSPSMETVVDFTVFTRFMYVYVYEYSGAGLFFFTKSASSSLKKTTKSDPLILPDCMTVACSPSYWSDMERQSITWRSYMPESLIQSITNVKTFSFSDAFLDLLFMA
jgi:hypothetical protein